MKWKTEFSSVVPILCVMLARSEKTIKAIDSVYASDEDALVVGGQTTKGICGTRIIFAYQHNDERELFYFNVDLTNCDTERSGFLKFRARLSPAGSLIKSASYLLHRDDFSDVRQFISSHSVVIIQDEFGVHLKYFDKSEWRIRVFGHYHRPIGRFENFYHPDL